MRFHEHSLRGNAAKAAATRLDVFDPRGRVLCALITSLVLSSVHSWQALIIGSIAPLMLFFTGSVKPLSNTLLKLNLASVFVCVLLPLTYPGRRLWGIFSMDGFDMALLITFKLNLISVVTIRMIGSMGMESGGVLKSLRFPDKLIMMLILTARYIFLLSERVAAMTRAVSLRAPGLRGMSMCRAFACMMGTTLIHSSDRAERSMLAINCRGGAEGLLLFGKPPMRWSVHDTALCVFFALNACVITGAALI